MANLPPVYIVSAARTPIGSFLGFVFFAPPCPSNALLHGEKDDAERVQRKEEQKKNTDKL